MSIRNLPELLNGAPKRCNPDSNHLGEGDKIGACSRELLCIP